ncbi:MAG: REP-associated tyrosine transposase [Panacagrimonas sp.]
MRTYTRARVAGGCYFFTVNLAERGGNDLLVRHIAELREAFRLTLRDHPFVIEAMVVLPDHLHCIWRLPENDSDFSTRWRLIKSRFSRLLPTGERISASRSRRDERGIWQRRFWEHLIRDERDWRNHVDYIHFNPVKHGLVARAVDWPHSSIHRFLREGIMEPHWAAGEAAVAMDRE